MLRLLVPWRRRRAAGLCFGVLCCSQDLEARHSGAALLLVGHGDTLSIGQATLQGVDVREHRQFSFETAELRRVHPTI